MLSKSNKYLVSCLLHLTDAVWELAHRQTLIDHYTFLVEEMNVEGTLLSVLLQHEVLDEQELDEISALTVRLERNAKLLELILRTSSAQYGQFLEALIESKQEHVYNTLHGTDKYKQCSW